MIFIWCVFYDFMAGCRTVAPVGMVTSQPLGPERSQLRSVVHKWASLIKGGSEIDSGDIILYLYTETTS